jgi:hypothetical protein
MNVASNMHPGSRRKVGMLALTHLMGGKHVMNGNMHISFTV